MEWWQFALLGAGGGALMEVLSIFNSLITWQGARRTPKGKVRKNRVSMKEYVDWPSHICLMPIRAFLGAVASWIFGGSGQITGLVAAVALGYAAPSVLTQLGALPQVRSLVVGDEHAESDEPPPASTSSNQPEVAESGR
jgi:hypothetical protein